MPPPTLTPYANESDVLRIGGLELENRLDRLTLMGDLVLSKDQAGLALARELQAVLSAAIAQLEADPALPPTIQRRPIKTVPNPFL